MLSVADDSTSSFGLVGTTAFWIGEEDSAVSCVSVSYVRDLLLRCERMLDLVFDLSIQFSYLEYFPIANFCRDTLATVHRTLSSLISGSRQLRRE
ncbi:hypothetical protein F511_46932 [Dorcoceras hygrometricum]|uniref:Uncharacterized protein n=1 Tax=Dorcoceras hygrometricum TaxID=472368 RepID=A0A2Z6ZZ14_9LAMI|nr:hypothetical protein F511_46932 [Dorcoceras hygrometricum]